MIRSNLGLCNQYELRFSLGDFITPNYTVILTRFIHVLLSFYLHFQCYVGILSAFKVFDHIGSMCEETKQFGCKTKKQWEITHKMTYMTFAMENAI